MRSQNFGIEIEMTGITRSTAARVIAGYFNTTATPERARINTIALFSGEYVAASGDYRDIRLFSKLNIPTEYLSLNKDLNIIYRVYTS